MSTLLTSRPTRNLPAWRRSPLWNMQELLEDFLPNLWDSDANWWTGDLAPSVDLVETDKSIEVSMDLPGIEPEDVNIELTNNILTVRGKRDEKREEKGKTMHRIERRMGTFSRSFALPCAVTEDEAAAEFHSGVLKITIPKAVEARTKTIKVKT